MALGWLIPGGGHFLLKRPGRGALLLVSVTGDVSVRPDDARRDVPAATGDLLTTLINTGGFIGDVCSGILYLLSVGLGTTSRTSPGMCTITAPSSWSPPGLLNMLAMVDAFEIAAGRKD